MFKRILLYYCFVLALFISISGIISIQTADDIIYQLMFLPVTFYLGYIVLRQVIARQPIETSSFSQNFKVIVVASIFFFFLLSCGLVTTITKSMNNSSVEVEPTGSNE